MTTCSLVLRDPSVLRHRGFRCLRELIVATGLLWMLAPGPSSAATAQVLYVTQSAAFEHDVLSHSETVLARLASESGRFDLTISHDASTLTAEVLHRYDAVIFYTTGELPLSDAQKAALLAYVRRGGGFVGVHSATDTFYEWPEYLDLIGGYFDGHPWRQTVTVQIENQAHPSTAHLGASFEINDEIYQFRDWSRANVDVLMSLDVTSVDMTTRGINRDDNDFALAWTRPEGDGRVFYTALGHRPEVWDDERFQRHLLEGIAWTMRPTEAAPANGAPNTLTETEIANGWELLFDGDNLSAWRGYKQSDRPNGWAAVDGTLARVDRAGDLITIDTFDDFELRFDWRVQTGGNSGVMFRVVEGDGPPWHTGPEFQILHNAGHRDGQVPMTSAGSNYAVHAPVRDVTRPVGTWNTAGLVVQGQHVEHWMNGVKLLEYQIGSLDWSERVRASKFAELPQYSLASSGHLAIQDHGDPVAFRNIKIRRLGASRGGKN